MIKKHMGMCNKMNTHPHNKDFVQTTSFGTFGDKYVIVMVALPARGKSHIARKLAWYLQFVHGADAKVFNLGDYRRDYYPNASVDMFDPNNEKGVKMRENCAERAMEDMKVYLKQNHSKGVVALFDATNSTKARRQWIFDNVSKKAKVIFIESIINNPSIERENIMSKLENSDYQGKEVHEALADFQQRVNFYKSVYEPIDDEHQVWIKVFNAGAKIILNNIRGYLLGKIATYVSCLRINKQRIYLTRHGQSEYNCDNRIGGDSGLTNNGMVYAQQLADFVEEKGLAKPEIKARLWTSTLRRTAETIQFFPSNIVQGWQVLRPKIWPCLDEIHAGVLDGLTYEQIEKHFPNEFALRKADKVSYRYPGGESYLDLIRRLEPVFLEIESSNVPIIIVAHNAVLRIIYSYLKQIPRQEAVRLEFRLNCLREIEPRTQTCSAKMFCLDEDCN
jgi:6-phosphofructo-2-kinase/fructose-2,6-biphosphatase 2